MRYLVTGGAGFLGANLCLRLLGEGHEVVALDDLSTGFSQNVERLRAHANFRLVRHDIVQPLPMLGAFDFIYNMACPASPPRYQKDPVQTLRTSVWGVWNVLQYAKAEGTPVLQTSTSEVYGDPQISPQAEDYWGHVNPVGARSCYDEGKRAAETLMMDFARREGHPVKLVRIFNTYGPYMDPDDGRVVSNFIVQALRGQPLTIYGDGKQTRSFCYVDDLIDGLRAMERSRAAFMGPVNLGNPDEFTLLQLADLVEEEAGHKLERRFEPLPGDDPKQRQPDITLAEKELGWRPKVKLANGISRTVAYFRTLLDL